MLFVPTHDNFIIFYMKTYEPILEIMLMSNTCLIKLPKCYFEDHQMLNFFTTYLTADYIIYITHLKFVLVSPQYPQGLFKGFQSGGHKKFRVRGHSKL